MSWPRWYGEPVFSGMVDHCGRIEAVERLNGTLRVWISSSFQDLVLGESVAVDGACLTVTANRGGSFSADVSVETQRLTIASSYQPGSVVNLERALRVGDRMGGHWVTGHVDTTLAISQMEDRGDCRWFRFDGFHRNDRPLLSKKGSICVNGVSLTLNEVGESHFTLLLVPHTLERTNLQKTVVGTAVNIEWDWMAKVVLEALQTRFAERKDEQSHPLH
jgi:riboflavin synthase